ncbi:ABC transporter substrate-binding protein [Phaeobacter inhibens]|uniref:ABC transporter substrate-binding protein n=1 Tax=Phaeobacter inhibens TaxID=221822 RepID=UPI0021A39F7B|nr:ABC transporter substrate-binding protein [Phaeobacter inhibens]UWR89320.1 ABC transporter substrate-binding protein [Phaeobacter inhibens]
MRFLVFPSAMTGLIRVFCLAVLALVLPALAVQAFEVEDQRRFGPAAGEASADILRVLSTTDTDLLAPLVESFLRTRPTVVVDYVSVSSSELMRAVVEEGAGFDLAVSSALDLQTKLANDGYTRAHSPGGRLKIPDWAVWRDHVFAFSQEPASIVLSPAAFDGLEMPRSRQALMSLLRRYPNRFRGRIGTYDVEKSGLGYMFATQDLRTSESFWRMMEIFGSLDLRLYCCSGEMIEAVARGELAIAYNVLGSYARARDDLAELIEIVDPQDYTNMMLRTAVVLQGAERPDLAGAFIDHLLRAAWGDGRDPAYPFPRYATAETRPTAALRPIQMGPGLLVFLDRLKRARFLEEWRSTVLQK